MKNFLNWRKKPAALPPADTKTAWIGAALSAELSRQHPLGRREGQALTRLAYQENPVAFRAVRLIAETASCLPWLLYEGGREYDRHPLLERLQRPNMGQSGQEWFETLYSHLLLHGNAFLNALLTEGEGEEELAELHLLAPERMQVQLGASGWPEAFTYRLGKFSQVYSLQGEPIAPLLHVKLFNPLDDHLGQSPLAAARASLEMHQAATEWNHALLAHAATPSGALVYQSGGGSQLSDAQFERLKNELEDNYQGRMNAGRPLLLEGGLDWRPMSLSPKDMDFLEARNAAARDIALAFGVPPMLLGIPGDNTYANYREANRALWRESILPMVMRTARALEAWLRPLYGSDFRLDVDRDQIEALADDREKLWSQISSADFLTEAEKREQLGFSKEAIRDPEGT